LGFASSPQPTGLAEGWTAPAFRGDLAALWPVELVAVEDDAQSALWRTLLERYHPLGSGPWCGAQQRYLIRSPIGWLGALAFSAAAWHLAARDVWIGWSAHARRANLSRVVANSRLLLLPTVEVPNLGSHVLRLAVERIKVDWPRRYGFTPLLLETFVDETRYRGTVYKAANWVRVGETSGRGRQDRENRAVAGVKGIYVLPLSPDWQAGLCTPPAPRLRLAEPVGPETPWVEQEFGAVELPDGRLRPRLLKLAEAFFQNPTAPIPQACAGDAGQTKAAYRFLHNPQVNLHTLLQPHYQATARRIADQPRVLVVQDTTSLNYTAHPLTDGLGPINTRADGAQGLKLHDTLAFTPDGIPLGLVDIQVWARDSEQMGKAKERKTRQFEEKESQRFAPPSAGWWTMRTNSSRCGTSSPTAPWPAASICTSPDGAGARRASPSSNSATPRSICVRPSSAKAKPSPCGASTPSNPPRRPAAKRGNGCCSPPSPPRPWKTPTNASPGTPGAGASRSTTAPSRAAAGSKTAVSATPTAS